MLKVQSLAKKLIACGIEAAGTKTVVKDLRINVFTQRYRRIDDPMFWGDIVPCGGLYNKLGGLEGAEEERCYQWKAGEDNVPLQYRRDGTIGARIVAHDIPNIVLLLPWCGVLALLVALLALLTRPDVIGILTR
jgi:hypothetical protein